MINIITIFFETLTILLFNNEINITNKTILSFNFTLFILNTKKRKKETIYMVMGWLSSIVQKPQVVTTRDFIV